MNMFLHQPVKSRKKYFKVSILVLLLIPVLSLTVNAQVYTLTVGVNPPGTGSVTPASGSSYPSGTVVNLDATPIAGYGFSIWTGDVDDPNAASTTIVMDSDKAVVANFLPLYTLTLNPVVPAGAGTVTANPTPGPYLEGTPVDLDATPNSGFAFDHWTGVPIDGSTFASTSITMNSDYTIGAVFVPTYTLTINLVPPGGGTVTPASGTSFPEGTVVDLAVTDDPSYLFDHWVGPVADTSSAFTTIVMDSDHTIEAHFTPLYDLTVNILPAGGGTVMVSPDPGPYPEGMIVDLDATANPGYEFDHWVGPVADTSAASTTIVMDSDHTIDAVFTPLYTLTIDIIPPGSGTVTPASGTSFPEGTIVNLDATPIGSYEFDFWVGPVADTSAASTTIVMDSDHTIEAHFIPTYTLTIIIDPPGSGTVTLDPPVGPYVEGTVVTMTAIANPQWFFERWEGDASGNENPTTITMDSDKTITAHFILLCTRYCSEYADEAGAPHFFSFCKYETYSTSLCFPFDGVWRCRYDRQDFIDRDPRPCVEAHCWCWLAEECGEDETECTVQCAETGCLISCETECGFDCEPAECHGYTGLNDSNCHYELGFVDDNCWECVGGGHPVSECSDYLSEESCIANPCEVPEVCTWDGIDCDVAGDMTCDELCNTYADGEGVSDYFSECSTGEPHGSNWCADVGGNQHCRYDRHDFISSNPNDCGLAHCWCWLSEECGEDDEECNLRCSDTGCEPLGTQTCDELCDGATTTAEWVSECTDTDSTTTSYCVSEGGTFKCVYTGSGSMIDRIDAIPTDCSMAHCYCWNKEECGADDSECNLRCTDSGCGPEIDVDFSADDTVVAPEETIQFTDTSTNSPTSWSWDFGDGETSTEQNPTHSYSATGTYTVTLTATNDYGEGTETKTEYIIVTEDGELPSTTVGPPSDDGGYTESICPAPPHDYINRLICLIMQLICVIINIIVPILTIMAATGGLMQLSPDPLIKSRGKAIIFGAIIGLAIIAGFIFLADLLITSASIVEECTGS